MIRISDWYARFGDYSFPTIFVRLLAVEKQALLEAAEDGPVVRGVIRRLQRAIRALPGSAFIGADVCVPADSPHYGNGCSVASGRKAWRLLTTSARVRNAFAAGLTDCLTLRPYRRMDKAREFRMFVHGRALKAMSQYCLIRHFARLDKRQTEIWRLGRDLTEAIAPLLPCDDVVVDVYLCADGSLLLVDLNAWGGDTDPKLLRTWDRDWDDEVGLKLIPKPVQMKGDVSVSF